MSSGSRYRGGLCALAIGATALLAMTGTVALTYRRIMYPPVPRVRQDRIHVAAVGDSNTYGAGVLFRGRARRSYPGRLQQLLGERYQVLNYGVNRRTLQHDGDWPYDATPSAEASVRVGADIVLIMLGSNDARGENWNAARFESELVAFVERYRAAGATVHLLTPPVAFENRRGVSARTIEAEVVPLVRRVARARDIGLIDVFEITKASVASHPDGIHLDARSSAIVAAAVAEALALPSPPLSRRTPRSSP
ncbi:GDSL-type esterase/lipase family protein [Microbacterium sp. NPDC028030]|uniref:GDSL-type esterase/lipase family protein n=1 Tax=Microbacterium sp. NPDC028030 TaxID=3155124 RepID=UPI00340AF5B9